MAEFNWVKALAECSLPNCFERLHSGVQSDAVARKSQTLDDRITFEVSRPGPDRIMVTRGGTGAPIPRVDFVLEHNVIVVEARLGEQFSEKFRATPGLNSPGECTLMVNGTELELWQVRRLALQDLFFSGLPQIAQRVAYGGL